MNSTIRILAFISFLILNVINLYAIDNTEIRVDNSKHELIAPDGESYQWYFEGELIQGAESGRIVAQNSGEYQVLVKDEQSNVAMSSITVEVTEESIIRIFIIGDSTVSNYGLSAYPFAGWGQVLQHFFDDSKISTHNRAVGGRSSRSFYEEERWDGTSGVLNELVAGDYVFIQFGHNDRDASNASRYTSPEDFKTYLRIYVNTSREIGAIPVLVSPMSMNTGTRNVFTESGSDYRGAMLAVSEELSVPFIDLNTKSYDFYQEIGTEYASYFIHMGLEAGEYSNYPDGYSDTWTHYQEMGALAMARFIREEIYDNQTNEELASLAAALTPLYNVSVSLNKPEAGLVTLSGDYPEGATVTLKARLTDNEVLKYWTESTDNTTMEGNLVSFAMQAKDYEFTGVVTDCFGTIDGTATIDECGVCTGGETGLNPCTQQIPCIDFCETNANVQLILDEENLYNLVLNTDGVANAFVNQQFNVLAAGSYLFALTYTNSTEGESLNVYVDDVLQISDLQIATNANWDIVEMSLDLEEGEHSIRIQTNSESGGAMFDDLALYSENINITECSESSFVQETSFSQSDNLIVIEAENYTDLKTGTNGTNWRKAQMDGTSSGQVVIAPTGTSYGAASTAQSTAPVLKYNVDFPATGTYSIWALVYAFNPSSDSYHLGIDGSVMIEKIDLYNSTNVYEEFTWMHVADKTLNVTTTGYQSLEVYLREPNLIIDKIILSPDATYAPAGLGPDETADQETALVDIIASDLEFIVCPNPAHSDVNISYTTLEAGDVNLSIFNSTGQKINELTKGFQPAGCHQTIWDFSSHTDLKSGLYILKLQTANGTQVRKLLINR